MAVEQGQGSATLKYQNAELSGPAELIGRGLYLAFAVGALWLWFSTLDAGRSFFEKKGYERVTRRILFLKILGFVLFVAFIVFCFRTGRI